MSKRPVNAICLLQCVCFHSTINISDDTEEEFDEKQNDSLPEEKTTEQQEKPSIESPGKHNRVVFDW